MNYYIIDSKTVRNTFLSENLNLNKKDCLIYFENNKSNQESMIKKEYLNILKKNNIKIKTKNICENKREDILQFIIASEIGFLIDKKNVENIYIVSKNKEFEAVKDFYKKYKNKNITIIENI